MSYFSPVQHPHNDAANDEPQNRGEEEEEDSSSSSSYPHFGIALIGIGISLILLFILCAYFQYQLESFRRQTSTQEPADPANETSSAALSAAEKDPKSDREDIIKKYLVGFQYLRQVPAPIQASASRMEDFPDIEAANGDSEDTDTETHSGHGESEVIHDPIEDNDTACAICLSTFKEGELVCRSTNDHCSHLFHKDCMEEWLLKHDDCPLCRHEYLGALNA